MGRWAGGGGWGGGGGGGGQGGGRGEEEEEGLERNDSSLFVTGIDSLILLIFRAPLGPPGAHRSARRGARKRIVVSALWYRCRRRTVGARSPLRRSRAPCRCCQAVRARSNRRPLLRSQA